MSSLINKQWRVFTNGVYHVGQMFRVTFVHRGRPHPNNEMFGRDVAMNLVAVALLLDGCS